MCTLMQPIRLCFMGSVHRVLTALIVLGVPWSASAQTNQPPGWADKLKLSEAVDTNPDPHIVELQLDARLADVQLESGERVQAWTYNGGLPGPLIRVHVGDRLIVH